MSNAYIPSDDRIDVIGRLQSRLDDAPEESIRDKAAARAEALAGDEHDKDRKKEMAKVGEKDGVKDDKETKDEKEGKEGKEFKEEGEKDGKDVKDNGEKEVKDDKDKDDKEGAKDTKDVGEKDGEKDVKDHHKDGGEKDGGEKEQGEKEFEIEGPFESARSPEPERARPTRPVM
jgi:hypothetical protein